MFFLLVEKPTKESTFFVTGRKELPYILRK